MGSLRSSTPLARCSESCSPPPEGESMATTTKSARLTAEEVTFLQALLQHFPEYRSESHLLHNATMVGLWILAVSARRPGLPAFGGYEAADLAALIGPRIMVAIDFLAEQG